MLTSSPLRTIVRPCTIVSLALIGPQRIQASIGSAIAPANRTPCSDHTATSPTAPICRLPISPRRPKQPAPPMVAHSSAMRASAAPAPLRNFANSIASRASIHNEAQSADDEPSTPSPTCTPAARNSIIGAMPEEIIMLLLGQCAAPIPAAPRA